MNVEMKSGRKNEPGERRAGGRGALVAVLGALAAAACGGGETTCTAFTYSAWGACQADGGQQRTVVSAVPTGCSQVGPILAQRCTPPPSASAQYAAKCASCHKPAESSTLKGGSPTMSTYGSAHGSETYDLTPPQLQAVLDLF